MTLAIDIGNTYIKIGVFKHDELLHAEQYQNTDAGIVKKVLNDYRVTRAIISSVKKEKTEWETGLAGKIPLTVFNPGMTKGIMNHYLTPETLGSDRLAAVTGARYLYPGKNNL